jgi:hypothetical protein
VTAALVTETPDPVLITVSSAGKFEELQEQNGDITRTKAVKLKEAVLVDTVAEAFAPDTASPFLLSCNDTDPVP